MAAAIASASLAATQRPVAAPDLARSLQQKYDLVKDWSADFVHTYRGGVLKKQVVERGRLLIKKPGKMRWQYTAPEEALYVDSTNGQ